MSYDPCHIYGACAIKTDGQSRHVCSKHAFGEALPLPSKSLRLQAAVATLGALGFADAPMVMPKPKRDIRRFLCADCGCRIGEGRAGRKCEQCRECVPKDVRDAIIGPTLAAEVNAIEERLANNPPQYVQMVLPKVS